MDRITRVWFKNLRTLADVSLDLGGLTVLVGDNGAGKSTLLEGLRLLKRCIEPDLVAKFDDVHGGGSTLVRTREARFGWGVRIEDGSGDQNPLEYSIELSFDRANGATRIARELLNLHEPNHSTPLRVIDRGDHGSRVFDQQSRTSVDCSFLEPSGSVLAAFALLPQQRALGRVVESLRKLQVHLPFDTRPYWSANTTGGEAPLRMSSRLKPAKSVGLFGRNLANVYHHLKNSFGDAHWAETMDLVRMGLGDDVAGIGLHADPGGGSIALRLNYSQHPEALPASALSDGTLAWLAFVAMFRTTPPGALIAFDEPELHLHPGLVGRVVDLFESMAKSGAVLLATHSDRVLDALQDPAGSVVVCELDNERRTILRRPDQKALASWMQSYAGYGSIRSAGHEPFILREPSP